MGAAFDDGYVHTIDGLKLFYRDYNAAPPGRTPVICLPGLTRNHRDFGPIADILASHRRVLCPDMRGRGRSDHDPHPENYNPVTETGDVLHMIDLLGLPPAVVIGASRGGIAAMLMAAMKPQVLAGAVLNDVGPKLERAGLLRIVATLALAPDSFASWDAAAASLKNANARFFPTFSDDDWRACARRLHAEIDGRPARDYDWKLARATETAVNDEPPTLWSQFDALAQKPLLVIRGGLSDILSAETLAEMARRAPTMRRLTLPDRGHTPVLDEPECVAAIEALLEEVDRHDP
jgi:pimeloyl-ACP methyl ester carboxylesterase